MTRKEIEKLLKQKFDNDMISNTEYVHYEMIVNEILGTNIHRNLNKRKTNTTKMKAVCVVWVCV